MLFNAFYPINIPIKWSLKNIFYIFFMGDNGEDDTRLKEIKALIRPVQDFPKPGIVFQDIFGIFQDSKASRYFSCLLK